MTETSGLLKHSPAPFQCKATSADTAFSGTKVKSLDSYTYRLREVTDRRLQPNERNKRNYKGGTKQLWTTHGTYLPNGIIIAVEYQPIWLSIMHQNVTHIQ